MNKKLISNKIEKDEFNFNNEEDDYIILINRLKKIGSIIKLLEKKT